MPPLSHFIPELSRIGATLVFLVVAVQLLGVQ